MWLLNTTSLKLRAFVEHIPDYVILSHTWDQEEVTFDDIHKPHAPRMAGYAKLKGCCELAVRDGFEWAWIDTCCIDKRSSAELSEAINSMYRWYWQAAICYAFLADVSPVRNDHWQWELRASRWFKRGWTLQELLAPDVVEFYSSSWSLLGTKSGLLHHIKEATKIEAKFIVNREAIKRASVATKLSWASLRQTTRAEDGAYCLLGLVGVNMPMLYGEGNRAFYRLQLEIIRQTHDQSILAWQPEVGEWHTNAVLAPSPTYFRSSARFQPSVVPKSAIGSAYEMTNNGLRIDLPCIKMGQDRLIAILDCEQDLGAPLGLWLEPVGRGRYQRLSGSKLSTLSEDEREDAEILQMYLVVESNTSAEPIDDRSALTIKAVWSDAECYISGINVFRRKPLRLLEIKYPVGFDYEKEKEQSTYLLKDLFLAEGEISCFRIIYGKTFERIAFDIVVALRNNRAVLIIPLQEAFSKDWVQELESENSDEWNLSGDHDLQIFKDVSIRTDAKKRFVDQQLLWTLNISILRCLCRATPCACHTMGSPFRHLQCFCNACVARRERTRLDHSKSCCCCACWSQEKSTRPDCQCPPEFFHEEGLEKGRRTLIQRGTGLHYLECPCKICELESKVIILGAEFVAERTVSLVDSRESLMSRRHFEWLRRLREKRTGGEDQRSFSSE